MKERIPILRLALPAIVTNITTPLLALLDVAITGHMGSAVYIAAIAVGGVMFNMLYWLFGFLRAGTSGMTAQAFGRRDPRGEWDTLVRSTVSAVAFGVALIALQGVLSGVILRFFDSDAETLAGARLYFDILIWGAPAVFVTYAATGWLLGMQNSRAGMWIALIINVTNIVTSLLLVYGCHWQIEGVATGTLVAQWVGALASALWCRSMVMRDGLHRAPKKADAKPLKPGPLFKVNLFIAMRTVCIIAVTVWFTRAGACEGTLTLAANTLLMQLFMLFSYFMDGFAYAGEALAGRYIGARDRRRLDRLIRRLMLWGVGLATLFSALYFGAGEWIMAILSDEPGVRGEASNYLLWAAAVPLMGFAAFVWDGVYVGATDTWRMLLSLALASALFFALYFALMPLWGNHGLWVAFCVYLLVRSVAQTFLWKSLRGY